jgi:hypothetical protein
MPISKSVDTARVKEWLGLQYPLQGFREYIMVRDLQLLQHLGEGVSREDYLIYMGRRTELGKLLTEAKLNFKEAERK